MKIELKAINRIIAILLIINVLLLIIKFADKNSNIDNAASESIRIKVLFENIPRNIKDLVVIEDKQKLGNRVLAEIIGIENIKKYPYSNSSGYEASNFTLDITVSKNLLKYTTLELYSPIAFETSKYRLDGKLIEIEGGGNYQAHKF